MLFIPLLLCIVNHVYSSTYNWFVCFRLPLAEEIASHSQTSSWAVATSEKKYTHPSSVKVQVVCLLPDHIPSIALKSVGYNWHSSKREFHSVD